MSTASKVEAFTFGDPMPVLDRAPNGKKDGIQFIPVSEVAAKDEFF
jgi:hypothetical protein